MYRIVLVSLFLIFSGCSLAPSYERPDLHLADKYIEPSAMGPGFADLTWWDLFKDATLQEIIRIALLENKDLKLAAARIEEVRAILGFTRSDQFPRLEGSGSAGRTDPSDKIINDPFPNGPNDQYGLSADLSFELDFWGRLSNSTEAAKEELLASEEAYRFVTITLISQVATTYFTILDLQEQLLIAKRTLLNRSDATKVIRARFEQGVAAELDLNQAQIEEADTTISYSAIERNLRIAQNALRVLLGNATYSFGWPSTVNPTEPHRDIPTLFPAELLNRRPDLLSLEHRAKAEFARIGVAKAERLPVIGVLGSIGLASYDSSDLLSRRAMTWDILGQFVGPIIDFGKGESKVEISEARAKQALVNYEQNVLLAIQDVEDSLVQIRTYEAENLQRGLQVKAASNAAKLSRARYDDGFTSYLEVLDIERSLFDAELGASSTRRQYLNSIVRLYKALGGGWSYTPETAGPLYIVVKN